MTSFPWQAPPPIAALDKDDGIPAFLKRDADNKVPNVNPSNSLQGLGQAALPPWAPTTSSHS